MMVDPTPEEAVKRALSGESVRYKGLVVGPGHTGLFPDVVDPAALREALAELRALRPSHDWDLIEAAAREFLRLMETAETVWWCEEHNKPALLQDFPNPSICTEQSKWCRMVEAVLTRRDT